MATGMASMGRTKGIASRKNKADIVNKRNTAEESISGKVAGRTPRKLSRDGYMAMKRAGGGKPGPEFTS